MVLLDRGYCSEKGRSYVFGVAFGNRKPGVDRLTLLHCVSCNFLSTNFVSLQGSVLYTTLSPSRAAFSTRRSLPPGQRSLHVSHNLLSLQGSVLYTTLFPSADSCKLLVQAGVKEMVYLENKYERHDAWVAARRLLMFAGVQVRKYRPPRTPAQKVGEETLSAGGGVTHSAEEETEARKAGLIGAGMVGAGSVECERSQYNKISADAGGGTSINKESSGKGFLGRGAMLRAVSGFLAGWMLSQLAAGS